MIFAPMNEARSCYTMYVDIFCALCIFSFRTVIQRTSLQLKTATNYFSGLNVFFVIWKTKSTIKSL